MHIFQAFLLAACVAASAHVHAAQIVVGQVAPLSGIDANQGRAYAAGMKLLFDNASQWNPAGHTFVVVSKDDGGHPEDTVAATRDLLATEKPMILAGYFGARGLAELVKAGTLEKNGIALVGYRSADIQAEAANLFNVRAGTRDEINKIVEHLGTIGINRIGLLYEDGTGGAAVVAAAEEAAKRVQASIVVKASHAAGSPNVARAVDVFLKAPPQAIVLISNGAAVAGFIEQYRAGGGAAQLFTHSGADIEQLSKRLSEEQMKGVALAQVTPNPYKVSGRLVKEFTDLVAKRPPAVPVSYAMMEGFIVARVIVEAVRRQGARPTREGTLAVLENMELDLGGYVLSYKPGMRTGSKFVELTIVSAAGRIRQ